jgi:hypothetical protein
MLSLEFLYMNSEAGQSIFRPESVIAAAVITQICVLGIVFLGAYFRRRFERPSYFLLNNNIFMYELAVALITMLIFFLSNAFSVFWVPVAKDLSFNGIIQWDSSILLVWIIDILSLSELVNYTGGSSSSPFTPLFFVFPTIALFLHEPIWRVILYAGLVFVLFTYRVWIYYGHRERYNLEETISKFPLCFVSVASFVLTTAIGVWTRK